MHQGGRSKRYKRNEWKEYYTHLVLVQTRVIIFMQQGYVWNLLLSTSTFLSGKHDMYKYCFNIYINIFYKQRQI